MLSSSKVLRKQLSEPHVSANKHLVRIRGMIESPHALEEKVAGCKYPRTRKCLFNHICAVKQWD